MIGAVVRCAARRLTRMRIAFLTGIWPPDVGGPATHGPDFARFLVARGHSVRVVTMGDGEPAERPCEVEVVSRRLPFPLRYGQVALRGARAARAADVVYATATYAAAAAAATAARRPLVAKLVSDPAYERARRYRLFEGTLEEFQSAASAPVRALKAARTRALRTATTIVVPSAYLAEIARGWGLSDAQGPRPHEPCAAAHRGRARAARPGHLRLRRPAHAPEGPRRCDRGRRPCAGRKARRRRRRPRAGRARAPGGGLRGRVPGALPRPANPRRDVAHRRRRRSRPPLERLGEPAALRGGGAVRRRARRLDGRRRSAGGRDRRRERLARSARRPGSRLRLRSAASSTSPACATGSQPAAKPSVEALSSDIVYGKLEALLSEAVR